MSLMALLGTYPSPPEPGSFEVWEQPAKSTADNTGLRAGLSELHMGWPQAFWA